MSFLMREVSHFSTNEFQILTILTTCFSSEKLYAEERKKGGSEYTKNSLCSIRFGLNRYFRSVFNNDIIKDKEFGEANSVYKAQCEALKKRGLAKTEYKPPIADEDIKRLYESGVFNTDSPMHYSAKQSIL